MHFPLSSKLDCCPHTVTVTVTVYSFTNCICLNCLQCRPPDVHYLYATCIVWTSHTAASLASSLVICPKYSKHTETNFHIQQWISWWIHQETSHFYLLSFLQPPTFTQFTVYVIDGLGENLKGYCTILLQCKGVSVVAFISNCPINTL
jgi:hypothetical protein